MIQIIHSGKRIQYLFKSLRKLSRRMSKLMREYPIMISFKCYSLYKARREKIDEADRMLGEPGLQDP